MISPDSIRPKMGINKADGTKIDGSPKSIMDVRAAKRRADEKEYLERRLSENTAKMNIIKKQKNQ